MRRHQTQVNNWMSDDPVTVSPRASLADAYDLMQENEIRRLLVVERDELVGIVTWSDIQRAVASWLDEQGDMKRRSLMSDRKVSDVMTHDPVTVDPEDSIQEAAERMLEYQVSGLPVVSGGRPVGIITESDIFRLVVESWAEALEPESE